MGMITLSGLPQAGRRRRTSVPVEHPDGDDAVAVVELETDGGRSYAVHGLIESPGRTERGALLCTAGAGGLVRAVVPRLYTHVSVERTGGALRGGGWRLGFLPSARCPELTGAGAAGDGGAEVLRYAGPSALVTFRCAADGARLYHRSPAGGGRQPRGAPAGGRLRLPGPGLLEIEAEGPWSLTLGSGAPPEGGGGE